MMFRKFLLALTLGLLLAVTAAVAAQSDSATPTPTFGALEQPTAIPTANLANQPTAVPTEDARLTICTAPSQPGFMPHIVRPGDRLADLMTGVLNLTPTQIAALNCLDDPLALPIGAVIWLPQTAASFIVAEPFDADPAVDLAEIISLTSGAEVVNNEAGVSFSWEAVGTAAFFYACPPDPEAECLRPAAARPVPLSYTTPFISGFHYSGAFRYRLEVVDGRETATEDITIEVVCAMLSLYPASEPLRCPVIPPQYTFSAWQPFQGGVMMWFSDTREIWVMTNHDSRFQIFPDRFTEGDPDPEVLPPAGLFTPVRGFGQIWESLGGAESALGWALTEELGFDAGRQPAGRTAYTVYLNGPGDTVYAITRLPNENSGWWVQVKS